MTSYEERILEGLKIFIGEEIELFIKYRHNDYMLYLDVFTFEISHSDPITSTTFENPQNLFPHTNEIQWGRLKAGGEHCFEDDTDQQYYVENPEDFCSDFLESCERFADDCIEVYEKEIINKAKKFSGLLIEDCAFEIIEKNNDRIDLTLKLGDLFDIDLIEFEPDFSEVLYEKSLEFLKLKSSNEFFWEGNRLNKSLEITINF